MKKELKDIRKTAYFMNQWDDLNLEYTINNKNISKQVIAFFNTESQLIYPAKSYFVAIVYAKCLEKYFKIDFFEALNDEELLPDDKYFKPYSKSKKIYNKILKNIDENIFNYKACVKTINYFKKEFLIWN